MKIKIILFLVFTHFFAIVGKAQNVEIEYIRKLYSEAKSSVQESEEDFGTINTIQLKRMIPALGSVETTINFYGNEEFSHDEESTYPWKYDGNKVLKFVNVAVDCHCTADAYIEYLFEPKSKELVFVYKNDPYEQTEDRFYFKNESLIGHKETVLLDNESTQSKEISKQDGFGTTESKKAEKHQKNADVYLEMFEKLYALEKIDKE